MNFNGSDIVMVKKRKLDVIESGTAITKLFLVRIVMMNELMLQKMKMFFKK